MKLRNRILIMILFIVILVAINNVSYAGTQSLNSLNYDVQLNSDGSADIVETWDIYIRETNTVFKNFKLDSSKYSGITNVKVKNLDTGSEFTQINQEMYHVTKDCYYALPIDNGKFEIAWGIGMDGLSGDRKYQISYTIQDAVKVYNDCSEFYWQFIGTDNGIPAKKVTGTIKLPTEVSKIKKLRVWAHGPLNGEIEKDSKDTVVFKVDDLDSSTMLETRVVIEEPIFAESTKKVNLDKLESIIEEETKWADEANSERARKRLAIFIFIVIYVLVFIFVGKKIIKYKKQLQEVSANQHKIDIGKYFRDIPRENDATPAEAAFLYFSKNNNFGMDTHKAQVFSATLLQLCLKGIIAFEAEDKKNIKINLLSNTDEKISKLKSSEKKILRLLKKIAGSSNSSLTMKQMKKYAQNNYDEFGDVMSGFKINAELSHTGIGNYDSENEKIVKKYNSKIIAYIIVLIFIIGLGKIALPIIIELIICMVLLKKIAQKTNVLTEQGETERQQWKGLKKYMEDFSMLDQRDVPDLVLWEKYLVYATAFGISEKVIKQLKVVYPEMENVTNSDYRYMYLMSRTSFGDSFINDFNRGINSAYAAYRSAYNAAHSSDSSGSGGGGGFSGGGGGRRWRWPEWVEDKVFVKE